MSNTSKIVTGIVVIILIIVGVVWYMGRSGAPAASNTAAVATTTQSVAVAPAPLDTSDASINADVTNIDAQMNGLNTDNTDTATLSAKQ